MAINSLQISYTDRTHILGKVIWISTVHRPLLSIMNNVFTLFRSNTTNKPSDIPFSAKQELYKLSALLPLAYVDLALPFAPTCVAFDASLQKGAVVFAAITKHQSRHF